jgi:hypothetical protein
MTKREFSQSDKDYALAKYGMICYVADHPIDEKDLEFDHIEPYSQGGKSDRDNIAPTCKEHNQKKGDMSLLEYRDRLRMTSFFNSPTSKILNDVLLARNVDFGKPVYKEIKDSSITLVTSGAIDFRGKILQN